NKNNEKKQEQIFIYMRHGERPTFSTLKNEKEKWRLSERYKTNNLDEPLTSYGIYETKLTIQKLFLNSNFDINKYDYIYSSPLTRCIQTALTAVDEINQKYNKNLKIRIEYALHEDINLSYRYFINFKNKDLIKNYYH